MERITYGTTSNLAHSALFNEIALDSFKNLSELTRGTPTMP